MGNDLRALLASCKSGLSEPEIGLEHEFVLLIWQMKHDKYMGEMAAKFARCPVCKNNCKLFAKTTGLILSVTFI
jgi:hypothetical protein